VSEYDAYVRAEWRMFVADTSRGRESVNSVAGRGVRYVLDLGCGAGQELLPFAVELGAVCVGVDVADEVGLAGRELFAGQAPNARVSFLRSEAESLPFLKNSFDVVICRLALPYTDNAQCLSEVERVLRPGGIFLLKTHHARYYLRKLQDGLRRLQLCSALHAGRVLIAGFIYLVSGQQPRATLPSRETFQTVALLRRELERLGFEILRELSDSNPRTPSFLIIKR
jgi:ubiquinone/menaquinone biosynthesis C-methylase UbiE